jgi:hypothetical protein
MMIAGASTALLSALLVISAKVSPIVGQMELGSCESQRERCVDRCNLSTAVFDCDRSENGKALAFSCACTDVGRNVNLDNVVVANTDSVIDDTDSSDPTYCDTERLECIKLCANSTTIASDGSETQVGSFPVFYCEVDSDIEGSVLASSCACDSDINMNESDDSMGPAGERAVDPSPLDPCYQRQLECAQSCDGLVPDFQCQADGDPNGASFSIASACSCASGDLAGSAGGGARSSRGAEDAEIAAGVESAENGDFDSGYRAGAKFVTGYMLSTLALMQAVTDGE